MECAVSDFYSPTKHYVQLWKNFGPRKGVSAANGSAATQQGKHNDKKYIDGGWRKKELLRTRIVHFNSHTEPFYSMTYVRSYLDQECMYRYVETSARARIVYLFIYLVRVLVGHSALVRCMRTATHSKSNWKMLLHRPTI